VGIEPATTRSRSACPANCAKQASGVDLGGPRRQRKAAAKRKARCGTLVSHPLRARQALGSVPRASTAKNPSRRRGREGDLVDHMNPPGR
jgi:hypothetical protein